MPGIILGQKPWVIKYSWIKLHSAYYFLKKRRQERSKLCIFEKCDGVRIIIAAWKLF